MNKIIIGMLKIIFISIYLKEFFIKLQLGVFRNICESLNLLYVINLYFKFDIVVILKIDIILRLVYYLMYSVIQLFIILINDILLQYFKDLRVVMFYNFYMYFCIFNIIYCLQYLWIFCGVDLRNFRFIVVIKILWVGLLFINFYVCFVFLNL